MSLQKAEKATIMGNFETHTGDTGSPEVQIALLTERINQLVEHLKFTIMIITLAVVC